MILNMFLNIRFMQDPFGEHFDRILYHPFSIVARKGVILDSRLTFLALFPIYCLLNHPHLSHLTLPHSTTLQYRLLLPPRVGNT